MIKNKIIFGKSPDEDVSSLTHTVSKQNVLQEFLKTQININGLKDAPEIISKNDSRFTIQKLSENRYNVHMTKRTSERMIAVGEVIIDEKLNIL